MILCALRGDGSSIIEFVGHHFESGVESVGARIVEVTDSRNSVFKINLLILSRKYE